MTKIPTLSETRPENLGPNHLPSNPGILPTRPGSVLWGGGPDTLFLRLISSLSALWDDFDENDHPQVIFPLRVERHELRMKLPIKSYLLACGLTEEFSGLKAGLGKLYSFSDYLYSVLSYGWKELGALPEIILPSQGGLPDFGVKEYHLFERTCDRDVMLCNKFRIFKRVRTDGYCVYSDQTGFLKHYLKELWTVCVEFENDDGEKRYTVLQDLTVSDCKLIEHYVGQDVLLGVDSEGGLENVMIIPLGMIRQYLDQAELVWVVSRNGGAYYQPERGGEPVRFEDLASWMKLGGKEKFVAFS